MAELHNRAPSQADNSATSVHPNDTTGCSAETPRRLADIPRRQAPDIPRRQAPDTPRRQAPDTPRSGAERMRALYGTASRQTPNTGTPPRRTGPSWQREQPDNGKHRDRHDHPPAPGRGEGVHGPEDRTAPRGGGDDRFGSGTNRADCTEAAEIDPRWLAGVSRPPDALPDDAGRAYHARSGDRELADLGGTHDQRDHGESARGQDTRDRLRPYVDRPAYRDRFDDRAPPDRYGQPLERPDGTRVPCLKGRPDRTQTEQGWLGDCGVIATLGAVASHRPGDIASRVGQQPDGTYKVSLHEALWTRDGAAPTGQMIELTVTPDLPVFDTAPDEPAFAQASEAAWAPALEKAMAGLDQTWTPQRQDDWDGMWQRLCDADAADEKIKNPRTGPPPHGYVRLNQGSTSWDRAELLTQLTGKESAVRCYPDDPKQLFQVLARQLRDGKPVLVASRARESEKERLPHKLEPCHAYEVVAVTDEKIHLRNPWNSADPDVISAKDFTINMQPNYTTQK